MSAEALLEKPDLFVENEVQPVCQVAVPWEEICQAVGIGWAGDLQPLL